MFNKDMRKESRAVLLQRLRCYQKVALCNFCNNCPSSFFFVFSVYVHTRQERRCRRGITGDNEQLPSPKNQGTLQREKRGTNPFRGIPE